MPTQTFKSKVDLWLAIVIAASVGAVTIASFVAASSGAMMLPVAALIFAGGAIFPIWIMTTTEYTLTDKELLVSSGPFKWRVPIGAISRVHSTRNPLSSPALSLDRIHIEYSRGKDVMISPRQKEEFLVALEARRKAVA